MRMVVRGNTMRCPIQSGRHRSHRPGGFSAQQWQKGAERENAKEAHARTSGSGAFCLSTKGANRV